MTDLKLSIEFETAKLSLMAAMKPDDLVSIWWRHCEPFYGEARERLQEVYAQRLRELGALAP